MTFPLSSGQHNGAFDDNCADLIVGPLVYSKPAHGYQNVLLPSGAGQVADLDGPAQGFIRIFDSIHMVSTTLAAGLTSAVLTLVSGGVSYVIQPATTSTVSSALKATPFPIGYGEVIRLTNGGANTGRLVATYIDIPAYNIVLVRQTLTATPVEVIPAAPGGYMRRWFYYGPIGTSPFIPAVPFYNADAITHNPEALLGSTMVARAASTTAGTFGNFPGPVQVPVTDTPLNMQLAAAVNTTAPYVLWAYETIPLEA